MKTKRDYLITIKPANGICDWIHKRWFIYVHGWNKRPQDLFNFRLQCKDQYGIIGTNWAASINVRRFMGESPTTWNAYCQGLIFQSRNIKGDY